MALLRTTYASSAACRLQRRQLASKDFARRSRWAKVNERDRVDFNTYFVRFLQPRKWKTPRAAVDEGNLCPQVHSLGFTIGDEDCLNLDVYIPANVNASQPLPVMVWIYGGAFVLGDKVSKNSAHVVCIARR